jgi:hypothetical protein
MPNEAVSFAFTTNALHREIANALNLATRVQRALHEDAPEHEKMKLEAIIKALEGVVVAASGVECPNPFFSFFTVDKDKLISRADD